MKTIAQWIPITFASLSSTYITRVWWGGGRGRVYSCDGHGVELSFHLKVDWLCQSQNSIGLVQGEFT